MRIGFLCLYGMGGRRDCGCIGLTVYCRDLPGAAAYAAEAPIASTQGGVGKLTTAASASAIASSDLGNRTSPIEHPYDRSRPGGNRRKTYAARCECAVAAQPNLRYGPITRRPPGEARREGS